MSDQIFLEKLQQEAARQAKLYSHRVLPPQIDWASQLIGRYPWQVILVVSGVTAWLLLSWRQL